MNKTTLLGAFAVFALLSAVLTGCPDNSKPGTTPASSSSASAPSAPSASGAPSATTKTGGGGGW